MVVWMDWVWIGKGLIYMAKWAFLKLLGKLRGLWEMSETIVTGKQIGRASCRERVSSPV